MTSIVYVSITSRVNNSFSIATRALTIDRITGRILGATVNAVNWSHLTNLALADPEYIESKEVDVLSDADIYGGTLVDGLIPRMNGFTVAQNTEFGWILSGKVNEVPKTTS